MLKTTDLKQDHNDRFRRALPQLLVFALMWAAWGFWELEPRLPYGAGSALIDSIVIKFLIWGLPALLLLRFRKGASALLPFHELFAAPFPWFALLVLLCLTTAFLYALRLAAGLSSTFLLFEPIYLAFSLGAGVIEEFVFRGYFFNRQGAVLGFWSAALVNGALFTLYHFPGLLYGGPWAQLLSLRTPLVFFVGVAFCWMFSKWRNLALCMAVHTAWDVLSYLFCLTG